MSSRWAVEIEGHPFTIERLESFLTASLTDLTDTFISRMRNVAALRSKLWDRVDDPEMVAGLAQTELTLVQGLTKLSGGSSELNIGTIFELNRDDSILHQTRSTINPVRFMERTCQPTEHFTHRLAVTRENDALAGAVMEIAGAPDWIKTYKAIEYLEEFYGGEKSMISALPSKKAALKRIKRTAQSVRHRARAFSNIAAPYDLTEAHKFVQMLLNEIMSEFPVQKSIRRKYQFVVPKREYHPQERIGLRPKILVNGEESDVVFDGDTVTVVYPQEN